MTYKIKHMQKLLSIMLVFSMALIMTACGSGKKDKNAELTEAKNKLEKLKKDKAGLDAQIRQVEARIAEIDPEASKQLRLVAVDTLVIRDFAHYIELQGNIDADGVAWVTPRGQGGQVRSIHVKQGDQVRKGQLILKLDDALYRQGLIAAQQQVSGLKAQVAQAQSLYERQQNLWKENIGTEVQVLNAKTAVESLQSQLAAAEANAQFAAEQVNQTNVTAEISGVIDLMNVKVGEFFTPASANPTSGIRIVNNNNLKMVTAVPENYISRVNRGDSVLIEVPETGKAPFRSVLSVVGASINATTRSFETEARLPSDPNLRPNQLATMKILDYKSKDAVTAPVNVVQTDEKGKYVFVIENAGGKSIVRKKPVTVGETYGGVTEIKSGLGAGALIITEGYQNVYDGQSVSISK